MKFLNFKMPLYEAETDTAGGAAGETQTEAQTEPTAEQTKTYTEEEMTAYKQQAEQEKQTAIEEALKKAKMTADEKVRYEQEQALKALEEREKNIALRELKADTAKLLADKGMSGKFLEVILDKDLKTTTKKIEVLKGIFDEAVQEQVESRLKGKSPVWGTETSTVNSIEEAFKRALER